jgi:tetratricopeptide (TPR) repeat protein
MRSNSRKVSFLFLILSTTACLIFFSRCSLPQIYILHDPLSPEEHLNLGVAYEQKGELDQALKEYGLAAEKLPRGYLYMGNIYFLKKDWTEAEKSYQRAIKEDPRNADAHNNLAWLYCALGENLDKAEDLAKQAMKLNQANMTYQDTFKKIQEKRHSPATKNPCSGL